MTTSAAAKWIMFSIALLASLAALAEAPGQPYEYSIVGTASDAAPAHPGAFALALMGGGDDVDEAFKWMIRKSGGGNFVVLRAVGTDAYNGYIYAFGGVASVETIIIPSRDAAHDPFVLARIHAAQALFIAGGDQGDYTNYWQGTPVETAIHDLVRRHIPIGGTSAGLAVMGQYTFTGLAGSVTSALALSNPYDETITLEHDFFSLPEMAGLITDSHLERRDRMGRLISFMAGIVNDGWTETARGIGIDEGTALLVEDGVAARVGAGSVYFLRTAGMPKVCKPLTPLTYSNLSVQRLSGAATFDMPNWRSDGSANYSISAVEGRLYSSQEDGAIY